MNIYITSATNMEVAASKAFADTMGNKHTTKEDVYIINKVHELHFFVHGVGAPYAQMHLQNLIYEHKPDLIIQAGIAGTFNSGASIGEVYNVTADRFADLGAQDDEDFLQLTDLGFAHTNVTTNGWLINIEQAYPAFFLGLRQVKGITTNTVTGNEKTAQLWKDLYAPQTESMEGAVLHLVCLQHKIPFVQLRSISNVVEKRDRTKWQIATAIENLNDTLIDFIKTL
jgi:futalosine hydrolase